MSQGEMEKYFPRRRQLSFTGEANVNWTTKLEEYIVMELPHISSQRYFIHVGTDLKQNEALWKQGLFSFN